MKNTVHPSTPARLAQAVLLALLGTAAAAQAQSVTPAQFAESCRTAPANTVVLTQVTTLQGAFPGSTTTTATGCTVVLGSGASLDFGTLTMRFGGPFVVQGGDGARVSLQQATVTAPTVSLQLTGSDGQFLMNESRLAATGGALSLQFGDKGFMEVKNSGGWYQPRLSARGRLNLSAGANFNGNIVQSGVQGARGIVMAFNGAESAMKIENTDMLLSSGAPNGGTYTNGPFQVTGSAAKQSFEIVQSNLMEAGAAVTIALNGSESKLARLSQPTVAFLGFRPFGARKSLIANG